MDSNIDTFINATISNFQNEECTICLEIIDDDYKILECNHVFHNSCFMTYYFFNQNNKKCPICRTHLLENISIEPFDTLNSTELIPLNTNQSLSTRIDTELIDNLNVGKRIIIVVTLIIFISCIGSVLHAILMMHLDTYNIQDTNHYNISHN